MIAPIITVDETTRVRHDIRWRRMVVVLRRECEWGDMHPRAVRRSYYVTWTDDDPEMLL